MDVMNLRNVVLVAGIGLSVGAWGLFDAAPAPPADAGLVEGNAFVLTVDLDERRESSVVLLVDENRADRGPDGRVERVFRLQAEAGSIAPRSLDLADAEIEWSRDHVTLRRQGNLVLSLETGVRGPSALDPVLRGFGLSHSTSWNEIRVPVGVVTPDALDDLRTAVLDALAGCDNYDCNAGGPGSLTCNYACGGTNCGVGCANGYIPCCGCQDDEACCQCRPMSPN